jgi:phosphatidylinositol glycan class O
MIEEIITRMDSDTTLLVFGDHGMTQDGNHGGGSELELRTVLFAFQKTPFPMSEIYAKNEDSFAFFDSKVKLSDLPAMVSVLLDLPFPFSNLGVFHPIFAYTNNIKRVHELYIENLEQIYTFVSEYCRVTE